MTRRNTSTAPAFLALACVGFIASAPAHAAAPESADPADDQDHRADIVVTGREAGRIAGSQGDRARGRIRRDRWWCCRRR
ncbi:MAG: hypothetical protein WDN44_05075 [Sphingomonas sp.]